MNSFSEDLIELINKHNLESIYNDTPDYVLANVAICAMTSFANNVTDRDRFHGFSRADKIKEKDEKENINFQSNKISDMVIGIADLLNAISGPNCIITRMGYVPSYSATKKKHKHNHRKFDDMGRIIKKGSKGNK